MYHYVYQITNLLNNMIYVGKRSSKVHPDIDPYFGSGVHLKRAIKKYGKESFKKEIVAIVDSADEAEELEEIIVDVDFIARKDTYNLVIGGQKGTRGLIITNERRAAVSKAHKGRNRQPFSEEHKAAISNAKTGKPHSEKHKAALSKAHKGKPSCAEGRIWMNDGKITKFVKPSDVDKYTSDGFFIGRI